MTDAPELLPCPFCGDTKSQRAVWVGLSYRVVCLPPLPLGMGDCADEFDEHDFYTGCGAMGVGHKTEKDAIAAWNTRADAARETQEAVAAALVEAAEVAANEADYVPHGPDNFRKAILALIPDAVRLLEERDAREKKLQDAVDAIAPWLSASLSPKENGGLGNDAGAEYRAACELVFAAAIREGK